MYCPKCGQELPADARYCLRCGEPVSAGARATKSTSGLVNPLTAILATIGVTHLSKKAMDSILVLGFFAIFFGCPTVCGVGYMIIQAILDKF